MKRAPTKQASSTVQNFVAESRALLRAMEEALLVLEKNPEDPDALNAVFRAAHTIKGTAGIFGFDELVAFTHVMENILDQVRAGEVGVDSILIALLLSCGDHCSALLDRIQADETEMDAALSMAGQTLIEQLEVYSVATLEVSSNTAVRTVEVQPESETKPVSQVKNTRLENNGLESMASDTVSSDTWHISLRFGKDVLRNGMEPLSFIRYLGTIGDIKTMVTLFDAMPDAHQMDAESCYLGVEIDFSSSADKAAIENVFEFVHDDCTICILPPHSKILDYVQLIESLPEGKSRLGELLVSGGALTERELEEGLHLQQSFDAQNKTPVSETEHAHKLGEILVDQGVVQNELVNAALHKQRIINERRAHENSFIRVRADKLDELITLVGELVIAESGTRLLAQRSGNGELIESTLSAETLVEEIRDSALKLRMLPIGETFSRFNRVVRDLGHELGKQVELVLSGMETELDKSMIEKIGDPLMHLVRNALDHGMESPQVRQQNGKAETGKISLNAYHDAGNIVIEVDDDGAGLNRQKILSRALERGLITAEQKLSDAEIYQLIMQPGFSTADAVTNVSGRGMGMDVVSRNIEDLRGSVTIDSAEGAGTTVVIRLPLTLAIIDGFMVGVGRATYVVPLDTVVECMELSAADRAAIHNRSYLNLRNQVLPLLRLRDVFDTTGEAGRRENIVVVQCAGQQAGLVVDALLGEFQTVIKPLGKLFEKLSGVSGSTILGSGEVALILDVAKLVGKAINQEMRQVSV